MVDLNEVQKQLEKVGYKPRGWGRGEVRELGNVMLPDEEIAAAVNGYYEGGFALLVASKERVLLVDKKPLNNLKFEDLRFEMISEFDYSHSLMGATVCISSGYKTLRFTSWRQTELRQLLNFVQCQMTEVKHLQSSQQEAQQQHLQQMNDQLQRYLLESERRNLELRQAGSPTHLVSYTPQTLTSTDSFERAADKLSQGLVGTPQISSDNTASQQILDSRQISFNAIRRVLPMVAAYGGRAFARYTRPRSRTSPLSPAEPIESGYM